MYRNIIFDIGNVLLNFKPEEYLRTKIANADKVSEVYQEIYRSSEWVMLDRGIITEEDAINRLIGRSEKNGNLIKLAFENWYELLTPIEDSVKLLGELKDANYSIYYLSNFHLLAFQYVIKRYDFFKLFDGGVVSFTENLVKPEEGIYKRIVERYGLEPSESIFVDDMADNIDAAKKLNFGTILFKGSGDLRERLKIFNAGPVERTKDD